MCSCLNKHSALGANKTSNSDLCNAHVYGRKFRFADRICIAIGVSFQFTRPRQMGPGMAGSGA